MRVLGMALQSNGVFLTENFSGKKFPQTGTTRGNDRRNRKVMKRPQFRSEKEDFSDPISGHDGEEEWGSETPAGPRGGES